MLIVLQRHFIKQVLGTALLAQMGQRQEEAAFAQAHLIPLAVMYGAEPPACLQ